MDNTEKLNDWIRVETIKTSLIRHIYMWLS